jgi:hypothetical protein
MLVVAWPSLPAMKYAANTIVIWTNCFAIARDEKLTFSDAWLIVFRFSNGDYTYSDSIEGWQSPGA